MSGRKLTPEQSQSINDAAQGIAQAAYVASLGQLDVTMMVLEQAIKGMLINAAPYASSQETFFEEIRKFGQRVEQDVRTGLANQALKDRPAANGQAA